MPLPYDLNGVRAVPAMYVGRRDYWLVAAYFDGLNAASYGSLLLGFREWLIPKLDGGNNLVWSAILLHLAFPGSDDPNEELSRNAGHAIAIEFLFRNFEEFWIERCGNEGMRVIYLRYQAWLERQDWYRPGTPGWIEPFSSSSGSA